MLAGPTGLWCVPTWLSAIGLDLAGDHTCPEPTLLLFCCLQLGRTQNKKGDAQVGLSLLVPPSHAKLELEHSNHMIRAAAEHSRKPSRRYTAGGALDMYFRCSVDRTRAPDAPASGPQSPPPCAPGCPFSHDRVLHLAAHAAERNNAMSVTLNVYQKTNFLCACACSPCVCA